MIDLKFLSAVCVLGMLFYVLGCYKLVANIFFVVTFPYFVYACISLYPFINQGYDITFIGCLM